MPDSIKADLSLAFGKLQGWANADFKPDLRDADPQLKGSMYQIAGLVVAVVGVSCVLRGLGNNHVAPVFFGGLVCVAGHDIIQYGRATYHANDLSQLPASAVLNAGAGARGFLEGIREALGQRNNVDKVFDRGVNEAARAKERSTLKQLVANTWLLKYFIPN